MEMAYCVLSPLRRSALGPLAGSNSWQRCFHHARRDRGCPRFLLRKSDHLTPGDDGLLSIRVEDLESGLMTKDLIHPVVVGPVHEATQRVPSSEKLDQEPSGVLPEEGVEDGTQRVPEARAARLIVPYGEIIVVWIGRFPAGGTSRALR